MPAHPHHEVVAAAEPGERERAVVGEQLAGDLAQVDAQLTALPSLAKVTVLGPDGFGASPLEAAAAYEARAPDVHRATVTRHVVARTDDLARRAALVRFASENRHVPQLKVLLAAGVEPHAEALQRAAGNGASRAVHWLLREGARAADAQRGDLGELVRLQLESAAGGVVLAPFTFVDLAAVQRRVRVWLSWLASLREQAAGQTLYGAALDGGRLAVNTVEALDAAPPERRERLRWSVGDFRFSSGHTPRFTPSDAALDERALAGRGDDDDRTDAQWRRRARGGETWPQRSRARLPPSSGPSWSPQADPCRGR